MDLSKSSGILTLGGVVTAERQPKPDAATVEVMRVMRRDCVRAYTEALTEYQAIEGQLGDIREHHRSRNPLLPPQRELIATLPDRGLRHGITLTRMAGALEGLADDPEVDSEPVGELGAIRAELLLMRRPVRLLADMYVLMIVVSSAEDIFGLPYIDSQLLPDYA
jgi:hypothetical protein